MSIIDTNKLPICLCMGSSCYTRGNSEIIDTINVFLKERKLENRVDFRGHLCQGHCSQGPNLCIGKTKYHEVNLSNINTILEDAFSPV